MKTKLSVLLLCLCSLTLLASCNNNSRQKVSTENISTSILKFLKHKYPTATILKTEKEHNGTEVDIREKNMHKEIWFDTKDQWVSTKWEIDSRNVPVAIMDALLSSAYSGYRIEDITLLKSRTACSMTSN